ncbi:MAG: HAD-IB family phosphatase [Terriglobia bacterium]|jgi:phosphoserine phosphatase
MPLTKSKRNKKEHLYFTLGASKKIYLGTSDKPRKEPLRQALAYLDGRIKKYEDEHFELRKLLLSENQNVDLQMRYKLVVFDLDGVIFDKPWRDTANEKVAVSSWDTLFQDVGFYNVHEKFKKEFEDGGFKTYTEWTDAACNFLKDIHLKKEQFEKTLSERPFVQGAAETLQELTSNGVRIAVVTGSFDALARRVKEIAPIHDIYAHCELHFDKEGFLKSWKLHPSDYEDKAGFVSKIAKEHNIPKEYRVYVGDDVNDLAAFKEVGLSIAFNSTKHLVRQGADVVIESRNLMSILPHLYDHQKRAAGQP